jgi:phosphonate transport system permease protein
MYAERRLDIRRLVFDSAFFAYSAILIVYGAAFSFRADQEYFIENFGALAWGALALLALSSVLAFIAAKRNFATVGDALFAGARRRQELREGSFFRSFRGLHLTLVFLATVAVSIQITEASVFELLDREGLAGAWRLWTGLAHPNFNLLAKAIVEAIETIFIAFLATTIAIPVAFVLAFFCAKNIMTHPAAAVVYAFLRLIMNVSRSVEPLIWALIFTVWVGVGPFAGMLALTVHSIASLAKYYSEILESVDDKPVDGVRSTGAHPAQVIWYAIVPQIVLPYIAMTIYRWDTNVRMATVIGLVGGGGIGTLLIQYQGQAMWPEVGCIILVIAVIVWMMDVASAYVREALK